MKYTSAEANKLLKKLNDDYGQLMAIDAESRTFLAATGEDIESVRPKYDYEDMKAKRDALCQKIRIVKHAINVFNTTTVVPEFGITIDEMLVWLPQLSNEVSRLDEMRSRLPKVRERSYGAGANATIDYRYANYDIETAAADYDAAFDLLAKAHTSLDLINNTEKFEVNL